MIRQRPTLGVAVLLVAALISCVFSLVQALFLGPDYRDADILADYDEQRLNEVRPLLSPFTAIEYHDDDPDGKRIGQTDYLTQYVLCPAVIVIDGPPQTRLLIDGRPHAEPVLDGQRRWTLERDAGNGVRLYRIEEP
jgi:hypothetical protein